MATFTFGKAFLASALFLAGALPCAALTVTQPTASTIVPAGDDYATQVLGNAWDMNDAVDIDTEESDFVTGQTYSSGIFTGATSANGAYVYPLFMGYASSINLSRGATHPIDTSHYRYVTVKLRATQPTGTTQFARVVFLETANSYSDGTHGNSQYLTLAANQWMIMTFDLINQIDPASPHLWTDFPQVMGLRVDPATTNASGTYKSVTFNIDWIRLTAPATSVQKTTVQWTDTGSGPYTIMAIDTAGTGTAYTLATGVSGTSYLADTSFLEPGQYQIQVSRSGASATSATFAINTPPQISITAPSVRGDQSRDFATTVVGNAWGPLSATDFSTNGTSQNGVINFKNVSYTNPVNSFYGRPTNSDPEWFLNLGKQTIDTSLYRSLCFDMEVFGPRSVGTGSVARVFWGNSVSALTTSQDIVLDDNQADTVVSEYCIPDLSMVPLEAGPSGGTWSGTKSVFRLDPDEFTPPAGCSTKDTCHDVRLDSVRLSPWCSADTGFTFTWNLASTVTNSIDIYLDPDTTPGNGNEILIGSTTAGNGPGQFVWHGGSVSGTYNVLFAVDDGINTVYQYAGGPLVVTADIIFQNGFEL